MSTTESANPSPDNVVIPFSVMSFNQSGYTKLVEHALGIKLKGNDLLRLATTFERVSDPLSAQRELGPSARHLQFGFMFVMTKEKVIRLIELKRNLTVNRTGTVKLGLDIALATGSLHDWRDNVITLMGDDSLRPVMNQLYDHLGILGYKHVFDNYRQRRTPYGFVLERK